MSKDVVVNGENYSGVSVIQLLTAVGTSAMFKDVDEINSLPNIAEIASGTFTVDASIIGGKGTSAAFTVPHGMNNAPDGFVIFPMYGYDTQDNNFMLSAWQRKTPANVQIGRRSVESNTTHFLGGLNDIYADENYIWPCGTTFGRFHPTYIDNDGNEGQQVYIWIAWKLAE